MSEKVAVALLMGGRSRRMGTDKAYLKDPKSGHPSWKRQIELLEGFHPAQRLLSIRSEQSRPDGLASTWQPVIDLVNDAGPISGLAACLQVLETPRLLLLGVDLLAMTDSALRDLLDQSTDACGTVYVRGNYFEPLAAVYPKCAAESALAYLHRGGRRLQDWLKTAVDSNWMNPVILPKNHQDAFANVNDPESYLSLTKS